MVRVSYCVEMVARLLGSRSVSPVPAEMVTFPVPYFITVTRSPAAITFAGTVSVREDVLFILIIRILSLATRV